MILQSFFNEFPLLCSIGCRISSRYYDSFRRKCTGENKFAGKPFYCATFAPILAGNDRQLINFEAQKQDLAVARIVVRYLRDQQNHQLEVRIIQESQNRITRTRKEILWNGQKLRAQNAIGKFPAVLFIPQMTAILEGLRKKDADI